MKDYELVNKLQELFPVFSETYDGDDHVYMVFGGLGSYFSDLMDLYGSDKIEFRSYYYSNVESFYKDRNILINEIKNIFIFIDELYSYEDNVIRDLLNTCILEAIIGSDYSYNLARKYLSKETYNHYLEICKRVI
ncbi:hypothetical protein [Xenorhabdus sp. SGI246]|uniref:DUF7674 family protein n=1 Tax=Xenorhabdus sp. SGI246 TaxID=3158263 RepID=UPI00349F9A6A